MLKKLPKQNEECWGTNMRTYLNEVAEFYRTKGAKDERPRKRRGEGEGGGGLKKKAWIALLTAGGVGAGLLAGKGKAIIRGSSSRKIAKQIAELDKAADKLAPTLYPKSSKRKISPEQLFQEAHKTRGTWKKRQALVDERELAKHTDKKLTRKDMVKLASALGLTGAGAGIVTKPFLQGEPKRKEPQYRYIPREYIPMPYYYYSSYEEEVAEFARTKGARDKKKRKSRKDMTRKELLAEDEKLKYAAGRGAKAGALGGALIGGGAGAASGALQGAVLGGASGAAGGPIGAGTGAALGAGGGALIGGATGALAGAPGGAINAAWAKQMEKRYRKKLMKGKKKAA